jgi:hypothetical protein
MSTVREWCAEHNEEALLADGFDDAIIGMAERCSKPALVVYDIEKCVDILVARDGMEWSDALEFLEFNTLGAWVGEMTPLFLRRRPELNGADDAENFGRPAAEDCR